MTTPSERPEKSGWYWAAHREIGHRRLVFVKLMSRGLHAGDPEQALDSYDHDWDWLPVQCFTDFVPCIDPLTPR